jgi:hypothetical protein
MVLISWSLALTLSILLTDMMCSTVAVRKMLYSPVRGRNRPTGREVAKLYNDFIEAFAFLFDPSDEAMNMPPQGNVSKAAASQ